MKETNAEIIAFIKEKLLKELYLHMEQFPEYLETMGEYEVCFDFSDVDENYVVVLIYDMRDSSVYIKYDYEEGLSMRCRTIVPLGKNEIRPGIYQKRLN